MSISDLKDYFHSIQISKVSDQFMFSSQSTSHKYDPFSIWKIRIKKEGSYTFSVSQQCPMMFSLKSGYKVSHVRMFLMRGPVSEPMIRIYQPD